MQYIIALLFTYLIFNDYHNIMIIYFTIDSKESASDLPCKTFVDPSR